MSEPLTEAQLAETEAFVQKYLALRAKQEMQRAYDGREANAMTYDHWKTADDTPEDELYQEDEMDELEAVYEKLFRLRASHDQLLAAAKEAADRIEEVWLGAVGEFDPYPYLRALRAAIAAAEEFSNA
jgi:hypothetical protein